MKIRYSGFLYIFVLIALPAHALDERGDNRMVGDSTVGEIKKIYRESRSLSPYDYLHNYIRGLENHFKLDFHIFKMSENGISIIEEAYNPITQTVEKTYIIQNENDALRYFQRLKIKNAEALAKEVGKRMQYVNAIQKTKGQDAVFIPQGTWDAYRKKISNQPPQKMNELKLFDPDNIDIPPRSVPRLTVSPNPYPHSYGPYGIKPITENPVPITAHNTPSLKLYIPDATPIPQGQYIKRGLIKGGITAGVVGTALQIPQTYYEYQAAPGNPAEKALIELDKITTLPFTPELVPGGVLSYRVLPRRFC